MLREKIIEAINRYQIEEAYVMIYFIDQVVVGIFNNKTLFIPQSFNEDLWSEIHVFNVDMELRCIKETDNFIQILSNKDYFEEEMFIIGNRSEIKDGYTILTQYGREVILPFEVDIKNAKHDLRLVVHHLFSAEGNYIDGYRLVDIRGGKQNG